LLTAQRLPNAPQLLERSKRGLQIFAVLFLTMTHLPLLQFVWTGDSEQDLAAQDSVLIAHYVAAAALIGGAGVAGMTLLSGIVRVLDNAVDLAALPKQQRAEREERAGKLRQLVRFVAVQVLMNSGACALACVYGSLRSLRSMPSRRPCVAVWAVAVLEAQGSVPDICQHQRCVRACLELGTRAMLTSACCALFAACVVVAMVFARWHPVPRFVAPAHATTTTLQSTT
jgi:hypothetical protein